jgi:hypothetical protein
MERFHLKKKTGCPVLPSGLFFLKAARIAEDVQDGACRRFETDLIHVFLHGTKLVAEGLELAVAC